MRNGGTKLLAATAMLSGVVTLAMVANMAAGTAANRIIEAQIAAIPGASVSAVSADLWRGRVTLTGLRLPASGGVVSAERVEMAGPTGGFGLIAPAHALDGAASIDNLVIEGGIITYKIPHADASGTSLTAADFAALLDPKNSIPAATRLASLNAAAISASEVIGTTKIGKVEQTITYKDVKFANIVNGKIGAASIAATNLAMKDASGAPVTVDIANTTARGIDLVLITRMMTQARSDAAEPLQTMYESFAADSITLNGVPGAAISIGRMSGTGFKGRAMATPYLALMTKLGTTLGPDKQPSLDDAKSFAAAYADLFRSIEMGSIEIKDIVLNVKDKGLPASFKLGRMAMSGLAGGKLGQFVYEGVDLNSEVAMVKLGNFSFRGLDFRPLLVMADTFSAKGDEGMQDPAVIRTFVPTLDHIGMNNLFLDAQATGDQPGNADGGKRNRFQLGAMAMDMGGFISGIPTNIGMSADHFTMDLTGLLNQPDMKDFAALGYKSVDFSTKFDLGWNEAANELSLTNLSADAAGMGALRVGATLGNATKDLFATDPNQQLGAVIGITAKTAQFSFVNDGLVDKAIAMQAVKAKKPAADIRKMVAAGASAIIPSILGDSKGAKEIADAVGKFLTTGKSLTISAVSPEGLGVGDLGLLENPSALLEKLEIKASANQ